MEMLNEVDKEKKKTELRTLHISSIIGKYRGKSTICN